MNVAKGFTSVKLLTEEKDFMKQFLPCLLNNSEDLPGVLENRRTKGHKGKVPKCQGEGDQRQSGNRGR